jgi:hypothetical protein
MQDLESLRVQNDSLNRVPANKRLMTREPKLVAYLINLGVELFELSGAVRAHGALLRGQIGRCALAKLYSSDVEDCVFSLLITGHIIIN